MAKASPSWRRKCASWPNDRATRQSRLRSSSSPSSSELSKSSKPCRPNTPIVSPRIAYREHARDNLRRRGPCLPYPSTTLLRGCCAGAHVEPVASSGLQGNARNSLDLGTETGTEWSISTLNGRYQPNCWTRACRCRAVQDPVKTWTRPARIRVNPRGKGSIVRAWQAVNWTISPNSHHMGPYLWAAIVLLTIADNGYERNVQVERLIQMDGSTCRLR